MREKKQKWCVCNMLYKTAYQYGDVISLMVRNNLLYKGNGIDTEPLAMRSVSLLDLDSNDQLNESSGANVSGRNIDKSDGNVTTANVHDVALDLMELKFNNDYSEFYLLSVLGGAKVRKQIYHCPLCGKNLEDMLLTENEEILHSLGLTMVDKDTVAFTFSGRFEEDVHTLENMDDDEASEFIQNKLLEYYGHAMQNLMTQLDTFLKEGSKA